MRLEDQNVRLAKLAQRLCARMTAGEPESDPGADTRWINTEVTPTVRCLWGRSRRQATVLREALQREWMAIRAQRVSPPLGDVCRVVPVRIDPGDRRRLARPYEHRQRGNDADPPQLSFPQDRENQPGE